LDPPPVDDFAPEPAEVVVGAVAVVVVVVTGVAETLVPGAVDFAPVLGAVGVETWSGPVVAPVVVVGTDGVVDVVVVAPGDDGTSVAALQIWAYTDDGMGGGELALSGSLLWKRQPSTSSAGLPTGCSAGPPFA
jgi:hypothetical protein